MTQGPKMPVRRKAGLRRMTAGLLALPLVLASARVFAQDDKDAAKKPGTDVITLINGDQLTGTLKSESDGNVVFDGDLSGTVTIPWKNIKSLHTGTKFAVITPDQKLRVGKPAPQVPVGQLQVSNDQISVSGANGQTGNISTAHAAYIVNGADFEKALSHEPSFRRDWTGAVTLGATSVQSTQTGETLTGAINLVRTEPGVTWLEPRNKTTFDAAATYGTLSQPFIPGVQDASSVKTNILHGDIERDQYVTPRFYYLFVGSADHNIGSGLRLQQIYGAGVGYSFIKQPLQTLDLRGDIHYQRQEFYPDVDYPGGETLNLIGASIGDLYMRKLPKGIVFNQNATILPAFNTPAGQPNAWSAQIGAGVLIPAYKHFGFTLAAQDNFINNPPSGFQKNTFQFTAGLTYSIQ